MIEFMKSTPLNDDIKPHGTPEKDNLSSSPTLASFVTASDVREVVRFLRRRPDGVPLMEANEMVRKRVFDPRKISAYELWGIVSRTGNRLSLGDLGWELAAWLSEEIEIYREILRRTTPYQAVLHWIDRYHLESVTREEVDRFWLDHHPEAIHHEIGEGYDVSFFDLCHAAEIGNATVGRKGHPGRLSIFSEELGIFVVNQKGATDLGDRGPNARSVIRETTGHPMVGQIQRSINSARRVFISHRCNTSLLSKLKAALELADMEYDFVARETLSDQPISEAAAEAMRRCQAGVIVLTPEDRSERSELIGRIEESVVVEIGAAIVQFGGRVVLLSSLNAQLHHSLQNLDRCEFEGEEPSWEVLIEMIKKLKDEMR